MSALGRRAVGRLSASGNRKQPFGEFMFMTPTDQHTPSGNSDVMGGYCWKKPFGSRFFHINEPEFSS